MLIALASFPFEPCRLHVHSWFPDLVVTLEGGINPEQSYAIWQWSLCSTRLAEFRCQQQQQFYTVLLCWYHPSACYETPRPLCCSHSWHVVLMCLTGTQFSRGYLYWIWSNQRLALHENLKGIFLSPILGKQQSQFTNTLKSLSLPHHAHLGKIT